MENVKRIGWSEHENQLCPAGCFDITTKDALMQKRREDASKHHYKQIWIKDAHGGPYSKVPPRDKSLDELVELGYERVETGPTTNFVGNHMTQAAIDLVQADLEDIDEEPHDQTNSAQPSPPRLLQAEIRGNDLPMARRKSICKYNWSDEGKAIRLQVGVGAPLVAVECCFRSNSMRLVLVDQQGASHELYLKKLWSEIREEECTWRIKGDVVVVFFVKKDVMATWDCLLAAGKERVAQNFALDQARFSELRKSLMRRKTTPVHGVFLENHHENKVSATEALDSNEMLIGDAGAVLELKSGGDDAYLCGNYGDAIRCYECALRVAGEEHCDHPFEECKGELIQKLAECCWKVGNHSKAIRYCKEIIQDPKSTRKMKAQGLILTAKVQEENENFQEASKSYVLANHLTPGLRIILDGVQRNKQMIKAFGLEN